MAAHKTPIAKGPQMIFAYADPPYIGQAKRHYSHDPQCAEVDHYALIHGLYRGFPDGWALSCSSPSLAEILAICDAYVSQSIIDGSEVRMPRIAAWCKPFCTFKKGVRPAYGWEPVLFFGGRNLKPPTPEKGGEQLTPKDFFVESMTMRKGLVGAKPLKVCHWILDLLNFVSKEDQLIDLYPGTGIMGMAVSQRRLLARVTVPEQLTVPI